MDLHKAGRAYTSRVIDRPYFVAERDSTHSHKPAERTRVASFILDHNSSRPRLLTMPGSCWRFERLVQHMRGDDGAFFIAAERHWSVHEWALRHMPGDGRSHFAVPLGTSDTDILRGHVTSDAVALNADVQNLPFIVPLLPRSAKSKQQQRRCLRTQCDAWTGAWVDLFGPIGTIPVARLLAHSHRLFAPYVQAVPYVITGLCGRDTVPLGPGTDPVQRRADMVSAALSVEGWSASVADAWTYPSLTGVANMVTICCLVQRV